MSVHSNEEYHEAEECVIVGSLQLFPGQAVDDMVGNEIENFSARATRQGTKTSLDGLFYGRVFCENEMVEFFVKETRADCYGDADVKSVEHESDAV